MSAGRRDHLTRRQFILGLGAGAILIPLGGLSGCSAGSGNRRPNMVFILTDDHRADALQSEQNPHLRTDNLARLAGEGVTFTNAFVTTSLCSPSRAGFLTGCYAHRHGVVDNELRDPDPGLPTFPTLLQQAGYETAFIGKWHQLRAGMPRPGFDHWVSFTGQGDYHRNTLNVDGEWVLSERYITDELTDRAVDWLGQPRQKPFLLYLSHKAAHAPFTPAPRHADAYGQVPFRSRNNPRDNLATKPDWQDRQPDNVIEDYLRDYHRSLLAVDESVGRVRAALEEMGELDNTVIIYAGDNGFLFGEHGGLVDKRSAYEPSLRIPLLMRYPTLATEARRCEEMVLNIDLAPTLLELAGVAAPATMQGQSWLDLIDGAAGRDAFLYEYFPGEGHVPLTLAVRTRKWKYIRYPDNPEMPEELYHLRYDPDELENRAADPEYGEQLRQMRALLEQLETRTGFDARAGDVDRR